MPPKSKATKRQAAAESEVESSPKKIKTAKHGNGTTATDALNILAEEEVKAPNRRRGRLPRATTAALPAPKPSPKLSGRGKPRKPQGAPKEPLTHPPTEPLDIFVFGSNSQAELGLGQDVNSIPVPRPRLNQLLLAAGVVQLALGGQHCVALSKDNQILTWGANDLSALGRDTTWNGGLVDAADDDDSSDSDGGATLNPKEATPTIVDFTFPPKTIITQVAASDCASFAVTGTGLVYGWGTFRNNEGHSMFAPNVEVQKTPTLMTSLKNVVKISTGDNHALALTSDGVVLGFGNNDSCQLGRKLIERHREKSLIPTPLKLPKGIVNIGAGAHHSFAITNTGLLYAWGSNNSGQTGLTQGVGEDRSNVIVPLCVDGLRNYGPIDHVAGGNSHSIAVSKDGICLTWGRLDSSQTGLDVASLPEECIIRNDYGRRVILSVAQPVPGLTKVKWVSAGIDCSMALTTDGKAYSWGFSESYRTGQGTEDDTKVAKLMDSKSIRDRSLVWLGTKGQFGVVAAKAVP